MLLAILLQSFSKAVIFADFYANQDYIANNLCVNRARKIIHCYGRCQLNRRLLEDEKQDNDNPERKETGWAIILFAEMAEGHVLPDPPAVTSSHWPVLPEPGIVDQPSFCFQPPD